MAWTYSNWAEQETAAEQYRVIKLHISEVSAQAGNPDVASDAKSVAHGSIGEYLKFLAAERDKLLARPGVGGGIRGGRSYVRVRRA